MSVNTDVPVLKNPQRIMKKIAYFWDKMSVGWKEIWGSHIHHGYYEDANILSSENAALKLLEKISALLDIKSDQSILDVGCGLGGSTLFLASHFAANVSGITLSPKQVALANMATPKSLIPLVTFHVEDAHTLSRFSDNSFDIVWSLESCEQFFDKELFIRQAFRVLKPNGKLMIATWCADRECYEGLEKRNYIKLCKAFTLPYMPTIDRYKEIIAHYGHLSQVLNWSDYVKKSWGLGLEKLRHYSFLKLWRLGRGLKGLKFIRYLKLMRSVFEAGQLQYAVFIAEKKPLTMY